MRTRDRQLGVGVRLRCARRHCASFALLATLAACASRPNIVGDGGRWPVALDCFAPGSAQVYVQSEPGELLAGVWAPPPAGSEPALVVLDVLPSGAALMQGPHATRGVYAELHALGCGALAFDWRGIGASEGERSSENVAADGRAMWNAALRRVDGDPRRVVVRGASLGGLGAGVMLAAGARPRALILVAPVLDETVVRNWADAHLSSAIGWSAQPFVRAPVGVDLCAEIDRAGCERVLALSGADDELLPSDDRARLRDAVERAGGTWVELARTDHVALGTASQRLSAAEIELIQLLLAR